MAEATWRKSSYSNNGDCVEVADLDDGSTGIRNSNHPDRGTLALRSTGIAAWIAGCAAGEFDDLT